MKLFTSSLLYLATSVPTALAKSSSSDKGPSVLPCVKLQVTYKHRVDPLTRAKALATDPIDPINKRFANSRGFKANYVGEGYDRHEDLIVSITWPKERLDLLTDDTYTTQVVYVKQIPVGKDIQTDYGIIPNEPFRDKLCIGCENIYYNLGPTFNVLKIPFLKTGSLTQTFASSVWAGSDDIIVNAHADGFKSLWFLYLNNEICKMYQVDPKVVKIEATTGRGADKTPVRKTGFAHIPFCEMHKKPAGEFDFVRDGDDVCSTADAKFRMSSAPKKDDAKTCALLKRTYVKDKDSNNVHVTLEYPKSAFSKGATRQVVVRLAKGFDAIKEGRYVEKDDEGALPVPKEALQNNECICDKSCTECTVTKDKYSTCKSSGCNVYKDDEIPSLKDIECPKCTKKCIGCEISRDDRSIVIPFSAGRTQQTFIYPISKDGGDVSEHWIIYRNDRLCPSAGRFDRKKVILFNNKESMGPLTMFDGPILGSRVLDKLVCALDPSGKAVRTLCKEHDEIVRFTKAHYKKVDNSAKFKLSASSKDKTADSSSVLLSNMFTSVSIPSSGTISGDVKDDASIVSVGSKHSENDPTNMIAGKEVF